MLPMIWSYAYTSNIWPMLVSALFSAGIAVYAWRHRIVPGGTAFSIQNLGVALWATFTAIEIAAVDIDAKILYHKLEAASALIALSAMVAFAFGHASVRKLSTRRNAYILSGVTAGIFILMVTNDLHHLLWTGFTFDQFLRVDRGPLNFVFMAWALFLPLVALIIFMRLFIRSKGIYRRQAMFLFIGAALPVLTYLLEPFGINPIAPLDPVILVWNVSSLLYAVAIFRFRMLEVVPIGRDTAIERTPNGIIILDAQNRIVDLNPTAREVLSLPLKEAIGQPVQKALRNQPNLAVLLEQETPEGEKVELKLSGQARYFEVQASALVHPSGFVMGRLIYMHNVTEQHQAQVKIIEQQRALAAMQERERLARELHDSLAQALAAAQLRTTAARRLLSQGETHEAEACLEQLADLTVSAQMDVREYLLGAKIFFPANLPFFGALREYIQRFSQQSKLEVTLSVPGEVEAKGLGQENELQLLRIIQEALSNIRKHAQASHAWVTFSTEDSRVQVAISDDGRGFDAAAGMAEGFGLQSMRERAESLGARFRVDSQPGKGTRVIIEAPLVNEAEVQAHVSMRRARLETTFGGGLADSEAAG